jgi:hypothetical protein
MIADLENGRRATVSVAELLILAAALGVEPVLLVVPLGRQPTVEILPGREAGTWQATQWVSGRGGIPDLVAAAPPSRYVGLYDQHRQLVRDIADSLWRIEALQDDPEALERLSGVRRSLERALASVRRDLCSLDLIPPELPPELAHIDKMDLTPPWPE